MDCKWCGKKCTDDYFILDLKRIQDSEMYVPSLLPSIILCYDCYEKLRARVSELDI